MKKFEKRIEAVGTFSTLKRIARDLHKLLEFEELEKLLVRKSVEILENDTQFMKFAELLGYSTSLNLFIQLYYEVEDHGIHDFETYTDLLRMISPGDDFGAEATKAVNKAAGDVTKISADTPLERLAVMAKALSDSGDSNYDEAYRSREGEIIMAALAKIGDNHREAFSFSRRFSGRTSRNRFLLAFVTKYGVKDRDAAELLSRGINTEKYFGCYLKAAIKEAAEKAGFEYDPDLETLKRRSRERAMGLLSTLLPVILGIGGIGRRSGFGLELPRRFEPDLSMSLGEICANCDSKGTEECVMHSLGTEMHISPSMMRGPEIFPGGIRRDDIGGLLDEIMGMGRRSKTPFPEIMDLFSMLGRSPWVEPQAAFLTDIPAELLEKLLTEKYNPQALSSKFGAYGTWGPEEVCLMLGPGEFMSIPDILASEETRDRIGPERVAVLKKYVALFNQP